MPTVLRKYGIRFHFYGYDMRERPHVHATGHGGAAKVWLDTIEFADHTGFNLVDQKRILDTVREHHAQTTEAWHEFARTVR